MRIKWSKKAVKDLQSLYAYIAADNPMAAVKFYERLYEVSKLLASQPGLGRPGRIPNTRELIVAGAPYIIPYRVRNQTIEIVRVIHASKLWPEKIM